MLKNDSRKDVKHRVYRRMQELTAMKMNYVNLFQSLSDVDDYVSRTVCAYTPMFVFMYIIVDCVIYD